VRLESLNQQKLSQSSSKTQEWSNTLEECNSQAFLQESLDCVGQSETKSLDGRMVLGIEEAFGRSAETEHSSLQGGVVVS